MCHLGTKGEGFRDIRAVGVLAQPEYEVTAWSGVGRDALIEVEEQQSLATKQSIDDAELFKIPMVLNCQPEATGADLLNGV